MIRCAQVVDGFIQNIGLFDSAPPGWLDITDTPGQIGWPVGSDDVPIPPQSAYHTVADDGGWELTPENQAAKETEETERERVREFHEEQAASELHGTTVEQVEAWIDAKIDPACDLNELKAAVKLVLKELAVFTV